MVVDRAFDFPADHLLLGVGVAGVAGNGQYELAEAQLEQASALFRNLDTRWQLGRTMFELGELAARQTQTAVAQEHYARALALFEEMGAGPDADRTRAKMGNRLS